MTGDNFIGHLMNTDQVPMLRAKTETECKPECWGCLFYSVISGNYLIHSSLEAALSPGR